MERSVDRPDIFPTPKELAVDLRRVVHELKRWKRLPLPALRGLVSVRFWQPPEAVRTRHAGDPNELVCAAIVQRINEGIGKMWPEEAQDALAAIFTFQHPKTQLKDRYAEATEHYVVGRESFRTSTEEKLLHELAEEMFRGELEWAAAHLDPALKE
jgi:hypothetical protein